MMAVNGHPTPARGSVLDACRAAGAPVAAFCSNGRLSRGGHCRACLVEIDGRVAAACTTAARDGLVVETETARLRSYRRDLGELMLAESAPAGGVRGAIEAWGSTGDRYARRPTPPPLGAAHPYLEIDLERCILCRQCVRACEEIQGQFVYAVVGRGAEARLHVGGEGLADSGCVSCGACVTVCPSGAITDADRRRESAAMRTVRTTCGYCGVGCQVDVAARDEGIVKIDGADAAVNHGQLCVKGRYAHGFVRHPERLGSPLVRRAGRLEPASWDEAIELIGREFSRLRGRLGGLSSSRCTNEENYLFQKWFRAGLGTHDVDNCARVCHAPSAVGMREAFGIGAATNSFDDIERSDAFLVVGANVTEAHPVVGARLKRAVLGGAGLVVVDPRRTELATIANVHLRPRPGTNVPLLNALACVLVEENLVDAAFLAERVTGWPEYQRFIRAVTPERTADLTGVAAELVRDAARLYGQAARPMAMHGLGVTEHYQGSEAVMLICNLAMLAGAVGRPGTGVNPLRGQNNVQGAADMGCLPDFLPGYAPIDDAPAVAGLEAIWGRPLPARPGRTLPRMLDAARAGEIRGMFLLGEDVMQTEPDRGHTREALEALEFLVVQELFLTETASLAHVVLPGASWLEKDGTFTNAERRIQRVRAALQSPGMARPDWRILCDLMRATGFPQAYQDPSEIMEEIARAAPIYAGVAYDRLDGDGLQWPVPTRDHPGTPILHVEGFAGGRGRLATVEYLPTPAARGSLTLVTGRVLEHYNAGTMTRRTPNRSLSPEDVLEIHPDDAAARGLVDGDRVEVSSARGVAVATARLTDRVREGVVFLSFHFPETRTNAVTGGVRDRRSDCPEYKVTGVEVRRSPVRDSLDQPAPVKDLGSARP